MSDRVCEVISLAGGRNGLLWFGPTRLVNNYSPLATDTEVNSCLSIY